MSVYTISSVSIKAYLQKADESKPILIGIIGLGIGVMIFIFEMLGVLQFSEFYGDSISAFSAPFFIICIMYASAEKFVHTQKNIKTLSGKIIDAEEEERKKISREIHDGVGQSLIAIKLNLQMMEAKEKNIKDFKQDNQFQNLISEVSDSIEELRNIAQNLRPAFIERIDIKEIIEWYSKKFQQKTGINIIIDCAHEVKDIDEKIKNNVYRIYQEALTNILKHSGANTVNVELRQEKNTLFLKISDNGRGFDYSGMKDKLKGIGLATF
ncbi:MAG: sensor histidine kinase [Candidatus Firestonebacteria bacterium]|nr:sensor histidine kinase [Candidatus Firestonebacteria bacterium]